MSSRYRVLRLSAYAVARKWAQPNPTQRGRRRNGCGVPRPGIHHIHPRVPSRRAPTLPARALARPRRRACRRPHSRLAVARVPPAVRCATYACGPWPPAPGKRAACTCCCCRNWTWMQRQAGQEYYYAATWPNSSPRRHQECLCLFVWNYYAGRLNSWHPLLCLRYNNNTSDIRFDLFVTPPFEKLLLSFVPIQSKKKNYRTTPGPGSGPRPMGPARSEMMRAAGCHACSSLVLDHSPMSCIPSLVSTSDKKKDFFVFSSICESIKNMFYNKKKTIRLHAKVFFPERSHVQVWSNTMICLRLMFK